MVFRFSLKELLIKGTKCMLIKQFTQSNMTNESKVVVGNWRIHFKREQSFKKKKKRGVCGGGGDEILSNHLF